MGSGTAGLQERFATAAVGTHYPSREMALRAETLLTISCRRLATCIDLAQQSCDIELGDMLGNPTTFNAVDMHDRGGHSSARCGSVHEHARVDPFEEPDRQHLPPSTA